MVINASTKNTIEIKDDYDLLNRMIKEQEHRNYSLSSHWKNASEATHSHLYHYGLSSFLSHPNSYGNLSSRHLLKHSIFTRVIYRLTSSLRNLFRLSPPPPIPPRYSPENSERAADSVFSQFIEALMSHPNNRALDTLEDSMVGQPKNIYWAGNRPFSLNFLRYFSYAQWLLNHYNIPQNACIVEIGPGYGGFCEVIKKLRPDLRYVIVDIAPQLYVAEQRTKAIFGNTHRVIGFDEMREIDEFDLSKVDSGTIIIAPPWSVKVLKGINVGINHTSFQEMTQEQTRIYIEQLKEGGMTCFYSVNVAAGISTMPNSTTLGFLVSCFREHGYILNQLNGCPQPEDLNFSNKDICADFAIFTRDNSYNEKLL